MKSTKPKPTHVRNKILNKNKNEEDILLEFENTKSLFDLHESLIGSIHIINGFKLHFIDKNRVEISKNCEQKCKYINVLQYKFTDDKFPKPNIVIQVTKRFNPDKLVYYKLARWDDKILKLM